MHLRKLLGLLLLVVFAMGLGEDLVSRADAIQTHIVCPEHGEVLHVVAQSAALANVIHTPSNDAHGRGCELDCFGGPPPVVQAPDLAVAALSWTDAVPTAPVAPRYCWYAPTLSFAPKTSPPTV